MMKVAFVGAVAAFWSPVRPRPSRSVYTWTGYGINVPGSSKCPTYKMTIDVTVDGNDGEGHVPAGGPAGAQASRRPWARTAPSRPRRWSAAAA